MEFHPPVLRLVLTNWLPSSPGASTYPWSCVKFPPASITPPSFQDPRNPLTQFYRPVALTSVVRKSFEHLAWAHLKNVIGQHYVLQHLDCPGIYARILFVDFSFSSKTVEIVVDFRRRPSALPALTRPNSPLSTMESFKFLGTTISQDPKWKYNKSMLKKA